MKQKQFQAHQGDVYIRRVDTVSGVEVPREAGRVILAYGEVTGHAHAITSNRAAMFRDDALGRTFVTVEGENAVVTHEEHAAVVLPPGLYEVTLQAQYTPSEIKRVVD